MLFVDEDRALLHAYGNPIELRLLFRFMAREGMPEKKPARSNGAVSTLLADGSISIRTRPTARAIGRSIRALPKRCAAGVR